MQKAKSKERTAAAKKVIQRESPTRFRAIKVSDEDHGHAGTDAVIYTRSSPWEKSTYLESSRGFVRAAHDDSFQTAEMVAEYELPGTRRIVRNIANTSDFQFRRSPLRQVVQSSSIISNERAFDANAQRERIVEIAIEKPVEVVVNKVVEIPSREVVEKLVIQRQEVPVEVPRDRIVEKIVEKIVIKTVEVPIERIVEKIVEVPVERIVERVVEKIVEVTREKIVEKIVEKIKEVQVKVPVDRVVERIVQLQVPVQVTVEKLVEKIIKVPVEVPVERIVEKLVTVQVEVPVLQVVEKIVEVPTERIVESIVQVPVEKLVTVTQERIVPQTVERIVTVEVPVERIVEVPVRQEVQVPVVREKIVHVEVPVVRERLVEPAISLKETEYLVDEGWANTTHRITLEDQQYIPRRHVETRVVDLPGTRTYHSLDGKRSVVDISALQRKIGVFNTDVVRERDSAVAEMSSKDSVASSVDRA